MSYFRTIAKDIKLDGVGDLLTKDGDFVIGESDQQHIDDILVSGKGNWREWPALGVEIHRSLNSTGQITNRVGLLRRIRLNLEFDNFNVQQLQFVRVNGNVQLKIDANRAR
ncbi:hypothetical protein [Flavilitoribacter nigricans]|uniref:Uncharacterized protein n=1 Tax=Flavilitoribacter nigricans (strain ATCC 23147 / DSM 23189 / NBRC 102662 / NCIMB 1420 / SS-2) TaxID=1122177 RepID=A0A2D0MWX7_FLAN2|nr:hypothetical protein [Flavilitoribacter nigricans]PHN00636.1 hypothetical protein CRP01_41245 [Flavilitoribacter nigricans DSM 23189 = NBRC 102662]